MRRPDRDGTPAVYVHGLGGSSTNWTDLAALLATRAAGIAVDLPGFGRSRPPAGSTSTPAAHTDALLCLLAGRERAGAPGRQLAGRAIALERRRATSRARAHADARLARHARPPPGPPAHVRPPDRAGHGSRPDRAARPGPGSAAIAPRARAEQTIRRSASATRRSCPSTGSRRPRRRSSSAARWRGPRRRGSGPPRPWSPAGGGAARRGRSPRACRRPTLVVWGDRDRLVTPRLAARTTATHPAGAAADAARSRARRPDRGPGEGRPGRRRALGTGETTGKMPDRSGVAPGRTATDRGVPMALPPLVEPAAELTKDEVERYSRHLIIPDVGMAGQKRLKNAKVLVVGAGGLGSPALLYLAAAGCGHARDRRVRRGRRVQPAAPDHPRPVRRGPLQGRVRPRLDQGDEPVRRGPPARAPARLEQRARHLPRLRPDPGRHGQLRHPVPGQRRRRAARQAVRLGLDLPVRGPGVGVLGGRAERAGPELPRPLPRAPAARDGAVVRRGRRAGRALRVDRLDHGQRGDQADHRHRRDRCSAG